MEKSTKQVKDLKRTRKKLIKIYYIGDFSKFYHTANYILPALEKFVEVVKKPEQDCRNIKEIIQEIDDLKPDLVLFHKARTYAPFTEIIRQIKERNIPTVTWLFDLYWDLPVNIGTRSLADPCFMADIVITTDGGHDERWKQIGMKHFTVRQGIHEPDHKMIKGGGKNVLFIGTVYTGDRRKIVNFLRKYYDNFVIHGRLSGFPNIPEWADEYRVKEVRGLKLNKVIGEGIVVGDSVQSPYYWSNRVYEITGRGGLLLHPHTEGLNEEFEPYKEYIPYKRNHFGDLKDIIDYYMTHDKEREAIRDAGFKRCGQYTYETRVKEFLSIICKQFNLTI